MSEEQPKKQPEEMTRKAAEQARKAYEAEVARRVVGFVVVVVLAGALWFYLNKSGYIYHDKMTTVHFHSWLAGEYKLCTSLNLKEEDSAPRVHCDLSPERFAEGKVFKVRFYAETYSKDKQEGVVHYWKCRMNGETDPAMTCELQESK